MNSRAFVMDARLFFITLFKELHKENKTVSPTIRVTNCFIPYDTHDYIYYNSIEQKRKVQYIF